MAQPARRASLIKAPERAHPIAPVSAVQTPAEPAPVPVAARMEMISARVPVELRRRLKRYQFDHDVTLQDVVTAALDDYMSTHP